MMFSDLRLLSMTGAEVALALVFVPYLRRRGWTVANVAGASRAADLARGGGVWLFRLVSYALIVPLGIVFTAYYLRTHRIWPVIVAHAIQDVVALAHFAR